MSAPTVERPPDLPEAPARPEGRRLLARVGRILSGIALACAVIVAALMVVPAVLGYHRYVVISGSMTPAIPTGSVVYNEVVPVGDLKVGDVITFVPPPEFDIELPVTHRIVDISPAPSGAQKGQPIYRTKGDANESMDPWRMVLDKPEQARVKHHIEKLGYVYMALSERWVQIVVIGIPSLVLVVLVAAALWREAGEAVMREEAEAAAAGAGA